MAPTTSSLCLSTSSLSRTWPRRKDGPVKGRKAHRKAAACGPPRGAHRQRGTSRQEGGTIGGPYNHFQPPRMEQRKRVTTGPSPIRPIKGAQMLASQETRVCKEHKLRRHKPGQQLTHATMTWAARATVRTDSPMPLRSQRTMYTANTRPPSDATPWKNGWQQSSLDGASTPQQQYERSQTNSTGQAGVHSFTDFGVKLEDRISHADR